jgi:hypothetical protein
MRDAGLMTTEQIDEQLRAMMFGLDGRHWLLDAHGGTWRSSDGGAWRADTPPA